MSLDGISLNDGTAIDLATIHADYAHPFTDGNDDIRGRDDAIADYLYGGDGDDIIYSGRGGYDSLEGGLGNDTLVGGAFCWGHPKTFIFGDYSWGQDVIETSPGNDAFTKRGNVIVFGPGIVQEDIFFSYTLDENGELKDLIIHRKGHPDSITIIDQFVARVIDDQIVYPIDTIRFHDGRTIDVTATTFMTGIVLPVGTEGPDTLTGDATQNRIVGLGGNDSLHGLGGDDYLEGGAGDDVLDGGPGIDTMKGGEGNDIYIVDSVNDSITEFTNQGSDWVHSSVSYTVGDEIENLMLTGNQAVNATGNASTNSLIGNAGSNRMVGNKGNDTLQGMDGHDTLDGGIGRDSMTGGIGDDAYYVDDSKDVLTELLNEGIDTVYSAVSWTLSNYFENLSLVNGSSINATGNSAANVLTGNAIGNLLKGNAGNDTLIGLDGNDSLDGGTGNDILEGGLGDDTYTINASNDVVKESADQGIDTVTTSVNWTLGQNTERLVMTGSKGLKGTGNAEHNWLTGAGANDTLSGLTGNDYIFGMQGNDSLLGGDGQDFVDGGAGIDTMIGGSGYDTYIVDNINDVVVEEVQGSETDEVQSYVSWTMSANIENLSLIGSSNVNATGNSGHNWIIGNAGNNLINGGAGNDTIGGGAGLDSLDAGLGNDTYLWGDEVGQTEIKNYDTTVGRTDVLVVSAFLEGQIWAERLANNDLVLHSNDGQRSVSVKGYFESNGTSGRQVDWIHVLYSFSPPQIYSVADVLALLPPPPPLGRSGTRVALPVLTNHVADLPIPLGASPLVTAEQAQSLIEANQQLVFDVQPLDSGTTEAPNTSTAPTWRGWDWRAAEWGLWDADGTADQRVGLPWYRPRPEFSSVDLGPTDSAVEPAEEVGKPVITRVTSPSIERAAALSANHQRLLEAIATFDDRAAADTGLSSTPWAWERL